MSNGIVTASRIHSYPLNIERRPAERLKDLPKNGFVQVIRADDTCSLRQGSADGYAVPALPGVVLPIGRGLYLQTLGDLDLVATGNLGSTQRGVLLLMYYETREEIVDVSYFKSMVGNRTLGWVSVVDGVAIVQYDGIPGAMHFASGLTFGFSEGASPSATASVVLFEISNDLGDSDEIYTVPVNGTVSREVFFPFPLFARPGYGLRALFPASGSAGVLGGIGIFGGTVFV